MYIVYGPGDRRAQAVRIAAGTQQDSEKGRRIRFLSSRQEHLRSKRFTKIRVLRVLHDADDLVRRIGLARANTEPEMASDRIAGAEIAGHERLVDNRDSRGAGPIASVEIPAGD